MDIGELLQQPDSLTTSQSHINRLQDAVEANFAEHFDAAAFGRTIYDRLNHQFGDASWENALVHGLQQLFPDFVVEHTGGHREELHGTDILLRIPGLTKSYSYGIAIQVKDYGGKVGSEVLRQIGKASYWQESGLCIIDRVVVLLRAAAVDNQSLVAAAEAITDAGSRIRLLFADDVAELLTAIAWQLVDLGEV